jgi:hypothetical protein
MLLSFQVLFKSKMKLVEKSSENQAQVQVQIKENK